MGIFTFLKRLYLEALRYDPNDVEANFNLAGLFLMRNELDLALKYYLQSLKKDQMDKFPEIKKLFGV